ncbi:MAG: cell division protein [Gammaproteobacteria bacterium]|nr:cell division protein [Gammaproteobacteria bacterium]
MNAVTGARRGARRKRSAVALARSWLRAHGAAAVSALRQLRRQPVNTTSTVTVIALALALPFVGYIALGNLGSIVGDWDRAATLSVFVGGDPGPDALARLADDMQLIPGVGGADIVRKDAALAELAADESFGNVLPLLDENPLPDLIVVRTDAAVLTDSQELEAIRARIASRPEVSAVVMDTAWIGRLVALMAIVERVLVLLTVGIGVGVAVVVGNTIRLNIAMREDEIVISKLFGATNGYVRRPFLYAGLWQGLAGGLLAAMFVVVACILVKPGVSALASTYGSAFELAFPSPAQWLGAVVIGGALGLAGAALSVSSHLRHQDRLP